jgi:hypothetical protein
MRPFIAPLVVLIATVGCTEPTNSTSFDPDFSVVIIGGFERLDPNGPDLGWVGVESTVILDREGTLVCDDAVEIEAWEVNDAGAELSLDLAREAIRDLRPNCTREYDRQTSRISGQQHLSFVATETRYGEVFGTVYTAADNGDWEPYATGMLDDGRLVYHTKRWVSADSVREPPAGDPMDGIRDLPEPPLKN